jgi:HK97 family phage major capsid protein
VLGKDTLRLKKLMALVAITDELLQDTTALGGYLPKKVATSIRWKTNEAILYGAGQRAAVRARCSPARS